MITKCIVVLSALSLSVGVSDAFNKCCAIGEVFSGVSKFSCVPTPQHAVEIYMVDFSNKSVTYGEIPVCEKLEDITIMALPKVSFDDFLQEPSCIEILHEPENVTSDLIYAYCKSNEDRNATYLQNIGAKSEPQYFTVRRCCFNNTIFNVTTARCESVLDVFEDYSEVNDFMSLMPKESDKLDFLKILRGPPNCTGPIVTYEIDAGDIVFANGTLQVMVTVNDTTTKNFNLNESTTTCLDLTGDSRSERRLVFRTCEDAGYCSHHKCITKCCHDEVKDNYWLCGVIHKTKPRATFYDEVADLVESQSLSDYGMLYRPNCPYGLYPLRRHEMDGLSPEGYLYLNINVEPMPHDQYCIDVYEQNQSERAFIAFVCFGSNQFEVANDPTRIIVSTILLAISSFFLFLTLIVYACLPALQNLHGKTLMCHSASLLGAYVSLAVIPWMTPEQSKNDLTTVLCLTLGYIMLFFFLSAFCWLNVMCFDIWRTFGRLQGNLTRNRGHTKKFFFYCLYACGLSMLIATCAVLTDEMSLLSDELRPNFGLINCWFTDAGGNHGELIFFRGPVAIQLTANVVFFILTAEQCNKVKAEISRVADPMDPRSRRFHANKTKFIMNVKLFIVMGITWVSELMSSFFNKYTELQYRHEIFYVSDIVNCLQGVMIFVLFVMKPRVHQALKARLGLTSKTSGSSHGTSMLQDPYKVKKSSSNSTLTSSFAVSVAP